MKVTQIDGIKLTAFAQNLAIVVLMVRTNKALQEVDSWMMWIGLVLTSAKTEMVLY